jgi:hypothetical protein
VLDHELKYLIFNIFSTSLSNLQQAWMWLKGKEVLIMRKEIPTPPHFAVALRVVSHGDRTSGPGAAAIAVAIGVECHI